MTHTTTGYPPIAGYIAVDGTDPIINIYGHGDTEALAFWNITAARRPRTVRTFPATARLIALIGPRGFCALRGQRWDLFRDDHGARIADLCDAGGMRAAVRRTP